MCACRSKCTYWMGATAPQRCELFVNYFVVYLTGRSSLHTGRGTFFYYGPQSLPWGKVAGRSPDGCGAVQASLRNICAFWSVGANGTGVLAFSDRSGDVPNGAMRTSVAFSYGPMPTSARGLAGEICSFPVTALLTYPRDDAGIAPHEKCFRGFRTAKNAPAA